LIACYAATTLISYLCIVNCCAELAKKDWDRLQPLDMRANECGRLKAGRSLSARHVAALHDVSVERADPSASSSVMSQSISSTPMDGREGPLLPNERIQSECEYGERLHVTDRRFQESVAPFHSTRLFGRYQITSHVVHPFNSFLLRAEAR
jgi:hypothetical protein